MADQASQIREQIAEERAALGDTVQALAAKADVKGRLKEKASETTEKLQHKASETTEKLQHKASDTAQKVRELTPDQAREGVGAAAQQVRKKPLPAAVIVALLLGLIIGKRMGRRSVRKAQQE